MDHLQFHHGKWRVRVTVPPGLVAVLGKRFLTRTTGTADYDRAVRASASILKEFFRRIGRAGGSRFASDARGGSNRLLGKNMMACRIDRRTSSSEWYTPAEVFHAMDDIVFDLDPCAPAKGVTFWVPAREFYTQAEDGLKQDWGNRFVWMNPPFGLVNGIGAWLEKFIENGNGVALVSDWTSTGWYHRLVGASDASFVVKPKIQFEPRQPGRGNSLGSALAAIGERGVAALEAMERNGRGLIQYRRRQ